MKEFIKSNIIPLFIVSLASIAFISLSVAVYLGQKDQEEKLAVICDTAFNMAETPKDSLLIIIANNDCRRF